LFTPKVISKKAVSAKIGYYLIDKSKIKIERVSTDILYLKGIAKRREKMRGIIDATCEEIDQTLTQYDTSV